ncbi:hypothetical protein PoB_001397700 [Plakobranchus ocellatus]|uniref:Uncharacterized protein n=1 Tax=Plakobranchus ocellatus TaxID=259542 RepID=A0AAV3YZ50_9GAST|nr:hypothetical protein PoB_001397700 [Plakobranchus ocellatus]
MVLLLRIEFNSLWILKGDLSATFADPFKLISINFFNCDHFAKGDMLINVGRSSAILLLATETAPRWSSVGQCCPSVSGEGNGQRGMLVSDSHYCRAITTATPRIHPSPHTDRTSRQTRRPHCGGGPLNYFQHCRVASYGTRQPRWSTFFPRAPNGGITSWQMHK